MAKTLQTANQNQIEHIKILLNAQSPLIYAVTSEESRFLNALMSDSKFKNSREIWFWSATSGIVKKWGDCQKGITCAGTEFEGTKVIQAALDKIFDYKIQDKKLVVILRDAHIVMNDITARRLRDMYDTFTDYGKTVLITSPFVAHAGGSGLHPLLEKQTVVVDFTLPTQNQIIEVAKTRLKESFYSAPEQMPAYTDNEWMQVGKSLQGLSMYEIESALAVAIASEKKFDPEKLMQEKKQLIRKSNILEYIDTDAKINDIGGLDLVKEYLIRYGEASTKEAEEFGVEPLKGVILTGIPGTGKSALVKCAGHLWKMPLVKLDIGRVMGKLVGQSEENMRSAIQFLEGAAPIVCWIDEIEKALSGTGSSDRSDGGTMSRVFGTLLTAMQEGLKGVTIIATSNSVENLPPELLRRFNEIFFVDLPSNEERWEIFKIHLEKRKREIKNFIGAKKELLEASDGFTGAEIEKAIKDAITLAFYNKEKDVRPRDVIQTLGETKPISKVQAENIVKLQKWASNHARFASSSSRDQHQKRKDAIKVENLDLSDVIKDIDKMKTSTDERKEESSKELPNTRFSNLNKDN